jgi:hypothetical protein
MNYTELYDAIIEYTENQETTFVSNIPVFVKNAEERIYRSVLIPEFRKNTSGSMTSGNRYLARPADFLSAFSLAVIDGDGDYSYLLDKDMNFMREAYPNPSVTGLPKYYAQFDGDVPTATGNFLLGPTPNANYAVELQYYYNPPSIVTTGTSWLGDNAMNALLFGSILQAYIYMKGDPDMMASYEAAMQEGMKGLGVIDVRAKRDSYRDGDMRIG